MKVVVHVDGGSRGNPGPAAAAAVVSAPDGEVLDEAMRALGETTNNVAEYEGLLLGLDRARALGATEVDVVNDSELVAHQVTGRYKVKHPDLRPLHAAALERLRGFEAWSLRPVPRAQNAEADALVNRCLDGAADGAPAARVGAAAPEPRTPPRGLVGALRAAVGEDAVLEPSAAYEQDATEGRGVRGRADAVVLPADAAGVARALAWCHDHDVPVVPRGGGTGYAGGAVPHDGGVVLGLERLRGVRALRPAAVAPLGRGGRPDRPRPPARARERRLLPARPRRGRAVAHRRQRRHQRRRPARLHARGHRRLGHRPGGRARAPGSWCTSAGPRARTSPATTSSRCWSARRARWASSCAVGLRLIPAPEAALPVVAAYPDAAAGCAAVEAVYGSGLRPAALEYLDEGAFAAARDAFPAALPDAGRFLLIAEAEGTAAGAAVLRDELVEVLGDGAAAVVTPAPAALWAWRWRAASR